MAEKEEMLQMQVQLLGDRLMKMAAVHEATAPTIVALNKEVDELKVETVRTDRSSPAHRPRHLIPSISGCY